jgi:hypothetical protein
MEDLIKYATRFEFGDLSVEKTSKKIDTWCIRVQGGYCVNHAGELEMEPSPSHRSENFLKRTRFSLEAALRMIEKLPKSGAY